MSKGRDDNHRLLHYKQSKLIQILLQTNAMIRNYSLFFFYLHNYFSYSLLEKVGGLSRIETSEQNLKT